MSAEPILFSDDGDVPNHPRWPLLLYRAAVDPAMLARSTHAMDERFEANGWPVGFRNGIYPFTHYHSVTHEALGIARGWAKVQFGGEAGQIVEARAGDIVLLPAGTGHKRIDSSDDLLVIGSYPPGAAYDLLRAGEGDAAGVRANIARVPKPVSDPAEGRGGPMLLLWAEA